MTFKNIVPGETSEIKFLAKQNVSNFKMILKANVGMLSNQMGDLTRFHFVSMGALSHTLHTAELDESTAMIKINNENGYLRKQSFSQNWAHFLCRKTKLNLVPAFVHTYV
jgi:hypothetical protein